MGKVNASIYKLALFLGVFLAYVIVNDVHVGFWVETPHVNITTTVDSTPGRNIFNPTAPLDTSQIDWEDDTCTTDTDCVIKHPEIIPDAATIDAYLAVYGDNPQFPTIGDCSRVDWLAQDGDGSWFVPFDKNNDGAIDCGSDIELGA